MTLIKKKEAEDELEAAAVAAAANDLGLDYNFVNENNVRTQKTSTY
jgi:hypothetical protein